MTLEEAKQAALAVEQSAPAQWEIRYQRPSVEYRGVLPSWCPIIYDVVSGLILEVALVFMYACYLNDSNSENKKNTLHAIAQDLCDWWRYLEAFELSWIDALTTNLDGYVASMRVTLSPKTGEEYSPTTIKRRISTIKSFYSWASTQNWIAQLTNARLDLLVSPGVAAAYFKRDLKSDHKPNPLLPMHAKAALHAVGLLPTELLAQISNITAASDSEKIQAKLTQECSLRLACHLALEVGLRVEEISKLPLNKFVEYIARDDFVDTGKYKLSVKGKGGKTRVIDIAGVLLREVVVYIKEIRPRIIDGAKKSSKNLLVHSMAAGIRWCGLHMSTRTLQRAFVGACISLGLTTAHVVSVVEDGKADAQKIVSKSLYTFHDLRHSYAVWTYYVLLREGTRDPWSAVQKQLGHSNKSTTLNIYLDIAGDYEAVMSDAYMEHILS